MESVFFMTKADKDEHPCHDIKTREDKKEQIKKVKDATRKREKGLKIAHKHTK